MLTLIFVIVVAIVIAHMLVTYPKQLGQLVLVVLLICFLQYMGG